MWRAVSVGPAVLALAILAFAPRTVHAQTGGVIYACVNTVNGQVRVVGPGAACKYPETLIQWNSGGGSAGTIVGQVGLECTLGADMTRTLVYVEGHAFTVYTGADGRFQIDSIPPATYKILIERDGQVIAELANVVVNLAVNSGLVTLGPLNLDDKQTDPNNCGGCGNVCPNGNICTAGACTSPCGPNQTTCNGTCVDIGTDVLNCGACGISCLPGGPGNAACIDGGCTLTCDSLTENCDGIISNGCETNTATDRNNCGACGLQCSPGFACTAGQCVSPCPFGQTLCNGQCRNLNNDVDNCGACGNVCGTDQVCVNGACFRDDDTQVFRSSVRQ